MSQQPPVLIRVVNEHNPDTEYHQWVTLGKRVKANRLGYSNPRMYETQWTKWLCNSGQCSAWALVHDDYISGVLDLMDAGGLSRLRDLRGTMVRLPPSGIDITIRNP